MFRLCYTDASQSSWTVPYMLTGDQMLTKSLIGTDIDGEIQTVSHNGKTSGQIYTVYIYRWADMDRKI